MILCSAADPGGVNMSLECIWRFVGEAITEQSGQILRDDRLEIKNADTALQNMA